MAGGSRHQSGGGSVRHITIRSRPDSFAALDVTVVKPSFYW